MVASGAINPTAIATDGLDVYFATSAAVVRAPVGGANDVGPVLAIDAYDPSTATFSAVGSLISARTNPTATLLDARE